MSGVRNLALLNQSASTSRVLNLSRITSNPQLGYGAEHVPFFQDHMLNRSILIKHRLRPDENYLFSGQAAVVTKIIFPFTHDDLKLGGRSLMVNQFGFKKSICSFLGKAEGRLLSDLTILELIDELPSLDPFLMREQLRRANHNPDEHYFTISPADAARMHSFVAGEISDLIKLAFGSGNSELNVEFVNKLVDALLATNADFRLEPLRQTLGLHGDQFAKGIFSWKGFLFYKWQFAENLAKLKGVSEKVDKVSFSVRPDRSMKEEIVNLRKTLKARIQNTARGCHRVLALYDDSFHDLTKRGNTIAFRKFLLDAPLLFVNLGRAMGMISHISSYWDFRFKPENPLVASPDEFLDVLIDFNRGLSMQARSSTSNTSFV